MSETETVI